MQRAPGIRRAQHTPPSCDAALRCSAHVPLHMQCTHEVQQAGRRARTCALDLAQGPLCQGLGVCIWCAPQQLQQVLVQLPTWVWSNCLPGFGAFAQHHLYPASTGHASSYPPPAMAGQCPICAHTLVWPELPGPAASPCFFGDKLSLLENLWRASSVSSFSLLAAADCAADSVTACTTCTPTRSSCPRVRSAHASVCTLACDQDMDVLHQVTADAYVRSKTIVCTFALSHCP